MSRDTISNNVVCATSRASYQPAHMHMIVKLLTEHHLEFLSLKGGCRGSSESTHRWKSHVTAQMCFSWKFFLSFQAYVSIGRIQEFLWTEDLNMDNVKFVKEAGTTTDNITKPS